MKTDSSYPRVEEAQNFTLMQSSLQNVQVSLLQRRSNPLNINVLHTLYNPFILSYCTLPFHDILVKCIYWYIVKNSLLPGCCTFCHGLVMVRFFFFLLFFLLI